MDVRAQGEQARLACGGGLPFTDAIRITQVTDLLPAMDDARDFAFTDGGQFQGYGRATQRAIQQIWRR